MKLVGKEKAGRERESYTIQQMKTAFLVDIGTIMMQHVQFDAWIVDD